MALAIDNARLYRKVQESAILEERERIAREMHDGMAQVLGYINTQTLAVKRFLSAGDYDNARSELSRMEEIARELYADIREGILGLRATARGDVDLEDALRSYAEQYTAMCGIVVNMNITGGPLSPIDPRTQIQLVRIFQEALSNVRKHAAEAEVRVHLSDCAGQLELRVSDTGQGFEVDRLPVTGQPRFGLQTMRERAESVGGYLEIESEPGHGTSLTARLPIKQPEII